MTGLISLFREPQDGYPSPESPDAAPQQVIETLEPLYFVELLRYLRERNTGEEGGDAPKRE